MNDLQIADSVKDAEGYERATSKVRFPGVEQPQVASPEAVAWGALVRAVYPNIGDGLVAAPAARFCEVLKVEAYDATVTLLCGPVDYLNLLMQKTPGWEPFVKDEQQGLVFWPNSREFYVVLDYAKVNLRLVLHEGYHLTNAILDEKGAFYGAEFDEHGALLHEYLTEWMINTLKKERMF
jgi:hypothetical protein